MVSRHKYHVRAPRNVLKRRLVHSPFLLFFSTFFTFLMLMDMMARADVLDRAEIYIYISMISIHT